MAARFDFPTSSGRVGWPPKAPTSPRVSRRALEGPGSRTSMGSEVKRQDCSVHVSGLDESITAEDLTSIFEPIGSVTNVKLNKDFTTGQRRDDAYVYFTEEQSAESAVRLLDGIELDGKRITVSRSNMKHNKVVVIGATITGMCAAVAADKAGASVVILDRGKHACNQTHTVSINLIGTTLQEELGIKDSVEDYVKDLSAGGSSENTRIVEQLAREASNPDLHSFLTDTLGLNFVRVHKSSGSTIPRTHMATNPDLGQAVRSALEQKILESESIRIITNVSVEKLLTEADPTGGDRVTGVTYTTTRPSGKVSTVKLYCDAVVVATGGYNSAEDLLTKFCGPEVAAMPRTFGEVGSGSGIRLLQDIGVLLVHMDKVSLHPTTFIDPKDPGVKEKWIAQEPLRIHGGLLVLPDGKRFVNEVDVKDSLVNTIKEKGQPHPFGPAGRDLPCAFIILNQAAAYPCEGLVRNYVAEGQMREYNGLEDLCKDLKIDQQGLTDTFVEVSKIARGQATDPLGRTNMPTNYSPYDKLYAGCITPALHYTVGGVATNQYAQVIREQTMTHVPGLFAAGEIAANVQGDHRIPGNALLEAVVFGRISGELAANYHPAIPALSPKAFVPLQLGAAIQLSPSTKLFRFNLPSPHHQAGLEMGQYVAVRKTINGEEIVRYYSPVSRADDLGHIDMVIKTDTGGALTAYMDAMKPGDTLDFKGPISGLELQVGTKKRIGMLAGGTGISPMLQLIRAHLLHEAKTGNEGYYDLSLVYAVKNTQEILLKDRLEHHKANHPHLRLHYVLVEPPPQLDYGRGVCYPGDHQAAYASPHG
eukprot:comp23856_c0_seq1/m.41714 comp23856_c0_seq1/g.41714  ORF comp23856_c0_seq1/g.41714 comp23856_c0_seq1/m.41714 type:complete len:817 (-) comp23856_c0_seq1:529-2979(-)